MPDGNRATATYLLRQGFRLAVQPPFVWLIALSMLATLATVPIEREDAGALIGMLLVSLISFYAAIALTLAAAEPTPDRSPETWVRGALARRCFWRSLGTLLFSTVLVFAGLLALIVPAFLIGARVALAEAAAVLENHRPGGNAIRRSIELSEPARSSVGTVYGLLVIIPSGALQLLFYLELLEPAWLVATAQSAALVLSAVAQIALTKAFLELGGRKLPRNQPAQKPEPS